MENKRGQGLSVNAIILIVLGVVVLVVLILGFTVGWDKIAPWIKTNNNVDTIAQACSTACTTQSTYDFCTVKRELKAEDKEVTASCAVFSVYSNYLIYGIEKCPSISCDVECKDISIDSKKAVEKDECLKTEEDITSIAKVATGKKCCIPK